MMSLPVCIMMSLPVGLWHQSMFHFCFYLWAGNSLRFAFILSVKGKASLYALEICVKTSLFRGLTWFSTWFSTAVRAPWSAGQGQTGVRDAATDGHGENSLAHTRGGQIQAAGRH